MAKQPIAISRASRDALLLLGSQIKTARLARRWSRAELAARIGVDDRTLAAVERGSASVSIGSAFNAAFTVGINLFGLEGDDLALARRRAEETLALLPRQARTVGTTSPADDDF